MLQSLLSVGIIGGADGPTAVFVTGSWGRAAVNGALILAAAAVLILALRKRKK